MFWSVALVTSLLETAGQMSLVAGHLDVMLVLGLGMYCINIIETYLFWRYGFLAPLLHRLAFYLAHHGRRDWYLTRRAPWRFRR